MNVQGQELTFEQYCLNHEAHPHCAGCGNCLYDPLCVHIRPAWCIGCYERIDKSMRPGIPRPWDGDGMVLFDYDNRFQNIWAAWVRASRWGEGTIIFPPKEEKGA